MTLAHRAALGLLAVAWLSLVPPDAECQTRYAGLSLTEALLDLQARGLKILFTSQVVLPEMEVGFEPTSKSLRGTLDQLLAPQGLRARVGLGGTLLVVPATSSIRGYVEEYRTSRPLAEVQILIPEIGVETLSDEEGSFVLTDVPPGTHTLEARRPGFVVGRLPEIPVAVGRTHQVAFVLVAAPVPLDEIVVTPSQISIARNPIQVVAIDPDEITKLPHLGDDLFRALTLLPGISADELSAEFHIRGGRGDEVLVVLDQLELFEPYHLKDFSNALSLIAPRAIAEVDLILGAFPAQFGDRMGGVLDMRSGAPDSSSRTHLGVSVLGAQTSSAGTFRDQRGGWHWVARFGSLELASDYLAEEEQPRYWDGFGKMEYRLNTSHRLAGRLLYGEDRLSFRILEGQEDLEQADTSYGNAYLWFTDQALVSPRLYVDSLVSVGRIERNRRADEVEGEDEEFRIRDQRILDILGVKQDWNFQPTDRHYLRWGFDLRTFDTEYDYLNRFQIDDPLEAIRDAPRAKTTEFRRRLKGEQYGFYLSNRLRLWQPLTVELGLRYDEQSVTRDRDLSPRFNLVLAAGKASTLRAAWGHFFQSQRLYELQVEDGETRFFAAERTEQYGLGFEHLLQHGASLRVDVYYRDLTDPRPRYENIFEPVSKFPEIEPDRVRVAPERSVAQGVEIFLRGRDRPRFDWWLTYAYARVEDELKGRDVPRRIDQPHTLNLDVNYQLSRHWTLNLAFRYHTGWPTTSIRLLQGEEGEPEPLFGPLNGERLSDYHRLDLRAHRQWQTRKGKLSLFVDLQNLYDRQNLAGFDLDFSSVTPDRRGLLIPIEEEWGGFLPSFGIDWEF